MILVAGDHAELYTSPDLKRWTQTSTFGADQGDHSGDWECPDLFPLQIEGETKWVMIISCGGKLHVSPRTQYFIGDFDGQTFTNDNPPSTVLWLDHGSDNYAAVTYDNAPDGQRILVGWMNNWAYARDIPPSTWRGAMTIPRRLELKRLLEGIRPLQVPVPQLAQLQEAPVSWHDQTVKPNENLLSGLRGNTLDIVAEFELETAQAFGFRVLKRSDSSQFTTIGYAVADAKLFVDRSRSGVTQFHPDFGVVQQAMLTPVGNRIKLRILVDRSSIEVFGGQDEAAITVQVFPDAHSNEIELYAVDGTIKLRSIEVFLLRSIWENTIKKQNIKSG